jgi:hypothetical protein
MGSVLRCYKRDWFGAAVIQSPKRRVGDWCEMAEEPGSYSVEIMSNHHEILDLI